jgi:UDP-N-acetyl-D-mannosaminuronic acid dehydrogenase
MGVDVYKVRELVNRSPYRDMHLPGAGVGGHCLPKDSWLLAFGAKGKYQPRLITAARAINDGMPLHMSDLCEDALVQAGRRVYGSIVTILGAAYLENADDTRNSPALRLIRELDVLGVTVVVHDPYVKELDGIAPLKDLEKALKGSDCIALVTAHDQYKNLDLDWAKGLMRTPIIVDGRHVFNREKCVEKGFIFRGVGERPG